ncbi:hypothetical protein V5O48_002526 [Marasmius crinis-equi]|uniref:Cytochrome P450 n=1 Tax=Marasmius crinis-equi TaxID=585013 RepID=A0ABR3FVE4_9AGAR
MSDWAPRSDRSRAIWGDDVNELKPERWLGKGILESTENGVKMPGIFSDIMTFLGGGRACPGMKFALLEIKVALSILIPHFKLEGASEEIDWRMGVTVVRYVKGKESKGPIAPMKVRLFVATVAPEEDQDLLEKPRLGSGDSNGQYDQHAQPINTNIYAIRLFSNAANTRTFITLY